MMFVLVRLVSESERYLLKSSNPSLTIDKNRTMMKGATAEMGLMGEMTLIDCRIAETKK